MGFGDPQSNQIKISVNHSNLDKIYIMKNAEVVSSDYVLFGRVHPSISISRLLHEITGFENMM